MFVFVSHPAAFPKMAFWHLHRLTVIQLMIKVTTDIKSTPLVYPESTLSKPYLTDWVIGEGTKFQKIDFRACT